MKADVDAWSFRLEAPNRGGNQVAGYRRHDADFDRGPFGRALDLTDAVGDLREASAYIAAERLSRLRQRQPPAGARKERLSDLAFELPQRTGKHRLHGVKLDGSPGDGTMLRDGQEAVDVPQSDVA